LTLKLSDNQIVEQIRRYRWLNGVKCPYCGSSKVIKYGKTPRRPYLQRYFRTNCRRQFNDLTSTPLAETRIPPSTVLAILYLYHKLDLSQSAVARELGVARTTVIRALRKFSKNLEAWFRLLEARSEVEVDKAYVPLDGKGRRQAWPRRRGGGRRRGRCTGRKKPFFTLVERGSRKALFLAEGDASSKTVATVLLGRVERGSTVYTDEFRGYRRVSRLGYEHLSVKYPGGSMLLARCM